MTKLGSTAAILACGLVVACGTSPASDQGQGGAVRLQLPPGTLNPSGTGLPTPEEAAPVSIGAGVVVCLNKPGTATVVDVSGDDATENFSVQQFALRPNPSMTGEYALGDHRGPLEDAGFDLGQRTVDAVCEPTTGSGYELGVQLARTGPGPATSRAFLVRWKSATGSGTIRIPLAVTLCDAPTAFPPRCDTGALIG